MLSVSKYQHCIRKIKVDYVPVNSVGVVSSSDVISSIHPVKTVLVTLMVVNNNSGSLHPVSNVAAHFQELQVLFHTNFFQAFRKVPVDLRGDLVEAYMVNIVGHKFGGPKGVDALYVQPGCLAKRG